MFVFIYIYIYIERERERERERLVARDYRPYLLMLLEDMRKIHIFLHLSCAFDYISGNEVVSY